MALLFLVHLHKIKIMKKISSIILIVGVVFTSCKKSSSNNSSCTLSASSIVGTYKITSVKLSTQGQTLEIFNNDIFFEPCERDDIYTINANGTYTITEGSNVCSPTGNDSGTWTLNGNVFTMDGTEVNTISEFNCSSFISASEPMAGEIFYTTMTRQ
jgi:hypothetical protein